MLQRKGYIMEQSLVFGRRAAGTDRRLTLFTLCLAVLVAQVDSSIVNLGVRPIGDYFHADVGELQWVVDSYNLVYAVLLLSGGLLADLRGRRRLFMIGAGLFTLASLICALAPSMGVLIAGRAVAGLGSALLVPASLAVIRVVWSDAAERGRALGIWAACNGLAMATGPTLGGVLIRQFGWRSMFFVVVPVSLLALLLARRSMVESADPRGRDFDVPAQLLGAVALGGLAFAAIEAQRRPLLAVGALVVAIVALVVFLRIERRKGDAALVPLDIFGIGAFRGAIIGTIGMTFGMYGTLFLVPLFWQESGRLDAIMAGLGLLPMALVFLLVSPFSGGLGKRFGARVVTSGGVGAIGLGLLVIAMGSGQPTIVVAELGLVLAGVGLGLATGPLMGESVGAVAAARSGTASALINEARMTGATAGVAILGTVYALAGGGAAGVRLALLLGGLVQLGCAAADFAQQRSAAVDG